MDGAWGPLETYLPERSSEYSRGFESRDSRGLSDPITFGEKVLSRAFLTLYTLSRLGERSQQKARE